MCPVRLTFKRMSRFKPSLHERDSLSCVTMALKPLCLMCSKKHDIHPVCIKGTCDFKAKQTDRRLFHNTSWELMGSRWRFELISYGFKPVL